MLGFINPPEIEWHLPEDIPDKGEYVIVFLKDTVSSPYNGNKLFGVESLVYKTVSNKFRFKMDYYTNIWTPKDIQMWGRLKTN